MELRPCRGVVATDLDGDTVVFAEAQQRLYHLDAGSAAVWSGCWGGAQSGNQLNCSSELATDFIASCFAEWEAIGLIGSPQSEPCGHVGPSLKPRRPRVSNRPPLLALNDVILIAGVRIAVSYPDMAVTRAVRRLVGHLRVADRMPTVFTVLVQQARGGYRVLGPSQSGPLLKDADAVAVWIKDTLLEAILVARPETIAIHSAALLSPRGAVLLVGPSGAGKTTLAAVLNAQGWSSVADDVVLIEPGSWCVRGLPFAYAVKPGSWPVLQNLFAGIKAQPEVVRPDGRVVKYIQPRRTAKAAEACPVAAVVFPQFKSGASLECRPLNKIAALVKILREARNAKHRLTQEGFLTLCAMLARSLVIEITYYDPFEASELLRKGLPALGHCTAVFDTLGRSGAARNTGLSQTHSNNVSVSPAPKSRMAIMC